MSDSIEDLKKKMTEIQAKIEELESAARERARLDSEGSSCDEVALATLPQAAKKPEIPQSSVHPDFRRKRIEDYPEYCPPNSWDPPRHAVCTSMGCAEGPYESVWPIHDEYIDPFK